MSKSKYWQKRDQRLCESFGAALVHLPVYYHCIVVDGVKDEYYSNSFLIVFPNKTKEFIGIVESHECYKLSQKQIVELVNRYSKMRFLNHLNYGKKD